MRKVGEKMITGNKEYHNERKDGKIIDRRIKARNDKARDREKNDKKININMKKGGREDDKREQRTK